VSSIPDNNRPDRDHDDSAIPEVDILVDPSLPAPVDPARLREAVIAAARYRGFTIGRIGIRVTDNATIRQCNDQFMKHDYPTDVISFGYELNPPRLEGEMIVSAEMARERAREIGWSSDHELLLYVVHGTLHLTGMDDRDAPSRTSMRDAERDVLVRLGIDEIVRFGADRQPLGDARAEELA
jgi:probable rRNA maturation factor